MKSFREIFYTRMHTARHAFTLVELSIVLVILGLLVGGVLTGQSLIHAAELRSITTDKNKYVTAIGTFKNKYFAIPGDMANASSFWPGLQNGDGNSLIAMDSSGGPNNVTETYLFWQHLSKASLIEGSYSGTRSLDDVVVGTDIPRSRVSGAAWAMEGTSNDVYACNYTGDYCFTSKHGNAFFFGMGLTNGNGVELPLGAILKSEDAWNIDTKIDDSKPNSGSVAAIDVSYIGCKSAEFDPAAVYSLNNSSIACTMIFSSGY